MEYKFAYFLFYFIISHVYDETTNSKVIVFSNND